jgi:type II secretory pathway pseudopilin PulG
MTGRETNPPMPIDTNGTMMRARKDVGETLIEIVLTIVIVGLTIAALLSSLATVGNASNAQRRSVQTDVVMRNYAEATKSATQTCVVGGTYTVVYPAPLPTGFTISGAGSACPMQVTVPQLLTLTVTGPFGPPTTMQIKVNTP